MATTYSLGQVAQCMRGRVVQVIAGSEKTVYHIHAKAFSNSESPSLRALVSEIWDPSGDKPIDWSHTEAATAERIFSYLYTELYAIPEPVSLGAANACPTMENNSLRIENDGTNGVAPASLEESIAENENMTPAKPESKSVEIVGDQAVQQAKHDKYMSRPLTPIEIHVQLQSFSPKSVEGLMKISRTDFPYSEYSYRDSLMALAQLYCFAVYHLLPSLQRMTVTRFVNTLTQMDCSQDHAASELVELVQYVYPNTPSGLTGNDPMRKAISQFVAINCTELLHGELQDCLGQGGEFLLDVMPKLCRKIRQAESVHQDLGQQLEDRDRQLKDRDCQLEDLGARLKKYRREAEEVRSELRSTSCPKCRKRLQSIEELYEAELDREQGF